MGRGALAALALLVTAACGSGGEQPAELAAEGAAALVGAWHVEADGVDPKAVLRLGKELTLERACGVASGSWRATDTGLLVVQVWSDAGTCAPGSGPFRDTAWASRTSGFRADGIRVELLDSSGEPVALLTPASGGAVGEPRAEEPPPPVPAGARAATAADLLRGWSAVVHGHPETPLDFARDGSWEVDVECGGSGGRWALGSDGELLAFSPGGRPSIGCSQYPVAVDDWLSQARRAVLDRGEQLVLLASDGEALGYLR